MRFVEVEVSKVTGAPRGRRKVFLAAEAIVQIEAESVHCCRVSMVNGEQLRVFHDVATLMGRISSEVDV